MPGLWRKRKSPSAHPGHSFRGRTEFPKCRYDGFLPVNRSQPSTERPSSTPGASKTSLFTRPKRWPPNLRPKYPPYIVVPYLRKPFGCELVKGTICKQVMELLSERLPLAHIVVEVRSTWNEAQGGLGETPYDFEEIKAIVRTCREMGLRALDELEADYEREAIEGWWIESACAEELRAEPVSQEVWSRQDESNQTLEGWWTGRESRQNRDWERWASPEIGPQGRFRTDEDF